MRRLNRGSADESHRSETACWLPSFKAARYRAAAGSPHVVFGVHSCPLVSIPVHSG